MTPETQAEMQRRLLEVKKCRDSLAYFARTYCQILASSDKCGAWIPFSLWPAQEQIAQDLETNREVIALKARQLGFTWLVIAFALQQLLFHPVATILLFSKRDDEAEELLHFRLREMYRRLPEWMRTDALTADKTHELAFATGSRALAFATTGGRSYTSTLAIIDEADHVPDLQGMLNAVKPTIDAGGRLILLSTVDKSQPESTFKKIYRAAKEGHNTYHPIFHGWRAAPWRTDEWYEEKKRTIFTQTGSDDDLHQEYPATEAEALSPRSLDKRIPGPWLQQCFQQVQPIRETASTPPELRMPAIPGLVVYARPKPGRRYVGGMDPAEGNPTSDDSSLSFLDVDTGEEVAKLAGKFEPAVFASYGHAIALYFNHAAVMVERNNHGHAVLLWFNNFGQGIRLLGGRDGKQGWMSSTLGKTEMYDNVADAFKNQEVILHSFSTFTQLASIDGSTLRAPDSQHDDEADGFTLAVCGRLRVRTCPAVPEMPFVMIPGKGCDDAPYFPGRASAVGRSPYSVSRQEWEILQRMIRPGKN